MSNSNACSCNAFFLCVNAPALIRTIKCNYKKHTLNYNTYLHHMCQISYEDRIRNQDRKLNYMCISCCDGEAEEKKNGDLNKETNANTFNYNLILAM